MPAIQPFDEIQFPALLRRVLPIAVDVRNQLLRIEVLLALGHTVGHEHALVHGGQERGVPERWPDDCRLLRTQHDESREVLVLRSEPVGKPRPHRRPAGLRVAGVHHEERRLVIRDVGDHRADHADLVGALADMRKQFAELRPALPIFLEAERRLHQDAGLALGHDLFARHRLPVVLVEHRLRVERVDLRHSAVHEQKDDLLGARLEVWLGDHWTAGRCRSSTGPEHGLIDQVGERRHAEAGAHRTQCLATRHGTSRRVMLARCLSIV